MSSVVTCENRHARPQLCGSENTWIGGSAAQHAPECDYKLRLSPGVATRLVAGPAHAAVDAKSDIMIGEGNYVGLYAARTNLNGNHDTYMLASYLPVFY